ncbi:MAG: hypothetical protein ACM4AI_24035 [Acidobacteriota bacterium]
MRRFQFLLAILPMMIAACGGGRSPSAPSEVPPPGATQACRVFATEWSSTYSFAAPTTSSASFGTVDRVYTEYSPAGSSQAVRRVTYGSVADFVDEAAVFGRFLSRRTETCPARENCSSGLPPSALLAVEVPSYDNQRRRTGLTAQLNGVILYTEAYTQWDSQGRPTAGTRSMPQACTLPLSATYDEATRTMAMGPSGPGTGPFCFGLAFALSQRFDANGNVVSETDAVGGTSTTVNNEIRATAQVCK